MKLGRKLLAYLLTISMLASMMVTGVSAENSDETQNETSIIEMQDDTTEGTDSTPAGEDSAPLPVDDDGAPIAKEDNVGAPPPVDDDGNIIPQMDDDGNIVAPADDDGVPATMNADDGDAAQPAATNGIELMSEEDGDTVDTTQYAVELDLSDGSITLTDGNYKVGSTTTSYSGEIKITTAASTTNTITVSSGEHSITLDNVTISGTSSGIALSSSTKLTVTLVGENSITNNTSNSSSTGISVASTADLTIKGATGDASASSLTVSGGGYGIGSSSAGDISILNTTVTAKSTYDYATSAAVIGGSSSAGDITITNAIVTVSTAHYGNGIGCGSGTAGTITIDGDSVVTVTSGYDGVAIGAKNFTKILITNTATVYAYAYASNAAIIGLTNASTGTGLITISESANVVTSALNLWTNAYNGAALGGSVINSNSTIGNEAVDIVIKDNATVAMYGRPMIFRANDVQIENPSYVFSVANTAYADDLYSKYESTSDPIYDSLTSDGTNAIQVIKMDDAVYGFSGILTLKEVDGDKSYSITCNTVAGNATSYYYLTFIVEPGEYKLYNEAGQVAQLNGEDITFDARDEYVRKDISGYEFVTDVSTDDVDFGDDETPYATIVENEEYFAEPTVSVTIGEDEVKLEGEFTYTYASSDYDTRAGVIAAIAAEATKPDGDFTVSYTMTATGDYVGTVTGTIYFAYSAETVKYTASGNTITVTLGDETLGKISIMPESDLVYDGEPKTAELVNTVTDLDLSDVDITYSTTPTDAGTYTASITVEGATASITFAISRASTTFSIADNSFAFGTIPAVAVTSNDDLSEGSDYTVKYLDSTGAEVILSNETPVGVYTVQITVTNSNYKLSGTVDSVVVYEGAIPTSNLSYELKGGEGATNQTNVEVGAITTLPTPTKTGSTFTGWSYGGKIYTAGTAFIQPEADVIMTATWVVDEFRVSGTITDEGGIAVTSQSVSLQSLDGNTTYDTVTTDSDGEFTFYDVAMGEYNIVATKTVDLVDIKTTTYVYVTGDTTVDKVMMEFSLSTSVAVAPELEKTTVSGLETVAVAAVTAEDTDVDAATVSTVKIAVSVTAANDVTALTAINNSSEDVGYTMDITVDMIVDTYEITPISETPELLSFTIDLPADMQGMAYYTVLRYHDDTVDTLKTSKNSDGEYIELVYTTMTDAEGTEVDVVTGIIIHAKYFSTYAVTSSETVPSTSGSTNVGTIIYPDETSTTSTDDDDEEEVEEETVATVGGFIDVFEDDYYADAVEWAVENDVTTGTTSTTFSPDELGTRAHVLTFLYRAFSSPETDGENVFDDVVDGSYYSDAVNWGIENGITNGIGNDLFGTDNTCTRAQIITFMWRAAGSPEMEGTHDFSDVEEGSYYEMALLWAVENGITDGLGDGTFGVDQPCTRAQIVTFLYRFLA